MMAQRHPLVGVSIIVSLLFIAASPAAAKPSKFLFFDPGANQFDIQALSGAFSRFLEHVDVEMTFQVVRDTTALSTMLRDPQVQFVMVNSDYMGTRDEGVTLEPLLVPTLAGDAYYRKILLDTGKTVDKNLRDRSVAASGATNGKDQGKLTGVLAALGVTGARLVTVPKDIDALLALSFGQVDAALVTPVSIDVLRQVNPQAAAHYRILAETKKILRSPLCGVTGRVPSQKVASMLAAFNAMSGQTEGRELMRRLAFDGWVKYDSGVSKR